MTPPRFSALLIAHREDLIVSDEQIRVVVRDLYAAYRERNSERLAALVDDDIDWIIYGPIEVFPFVGQKRGKAAVIETFAIIASLYDVDSFEPEVTVVDGDQAAVLVNATFVQRSSGRKLRVRLANFLRFRDGRLVRFREFFDSFDAVEQALGRVLPV
jgi:ketosteroid isomerase-like protein